MTIFHSYVCVPPKEDFVLLPCCIVWRKHTAEATHWRHLIRSCVSLLGPHFTTPAVNHRTSSPFFDVFHFPRPSRARCCPAIRLSNRFGRLVIYLEVLLIAVRISSVGRDMGIHQLLSTRCFVCTPCFSSLQRPPTSRHAHTPKCTCHVVWYVRLCVCVCVFFVLRSSGILVWRGLSIPNGAGAADEVRGLAGQAGRSEG